MLSHADIEINLNPRMNRIYTASYISGEWLYLSDLCSAMCSRSEIRRFAEEAKSIGVDYIGVCCGNSPAFTREVAEVYERKPIGSKHSPDISKSFLWGDFYDKESKHRQKWRQFALFGKDCSD